MTEKCRTDWESLKGEALREVVRMGDANLTASVTIALASDQRATTQFGILSAIAVGLFAAAASVENTDAAVSFFCAAIGMVVSGFVSGFGARPRNFVMPGAMPSRLVGSAETVDQLLRHYAENLDEMITINSKVLSRQARFTVYGYYAAVLSLLLSALLYFWRAGFPTDLDLF